MTMARFRPDLNRLHIAKAFLGTHGALRHTGLAHAVYCSAYNYGRLIIGADRAIESGLPRAGIGSETVPTA